MICSVGEARSDNLDNTDRRNQKAYKLLLYGKNSMVLKALPNIFQP